MHEIYLLLHIHLRATHKWKIQLRKIWKIITWERERCNAIYEVMGHWINL